MPFTEFDSDQKYTLSKVLRVADTETPAGEIARHFWVIPVYRPSRITVQAITRNSTDMQITLSGNLYGIDGNYANANSEATFTNDSNDIHNFFELGQTTVTTNRGMGTITSTVPCTHISLEVEATKRNQTLNVIAYVLASF